jgi:predicted amidohydrolase YtcJ
MSKPNNIDKIFTEGLEGYQVHPSSDVKSKIFASPMVIKPQKRWYLSKGFLLAGLFIITSSIIAGIMLFSSANSKSDGLFIDKAQNLLSAINTKSALSQETLTNSDNINTTQLKQASVIKNQSTEILTNNSSNKENHSLQETNQDKIIKNKQIIQNTNPLNASLTKQEKQNINNNDSDKLLTQNNSTKLQIDESTISKTVSSNELNQNKQTNSSSVSMNIFYQHRNKQ